MTWKILQHSPQHYKGQREIAAKPALIMWLESNCRLFYLNLLLHCDRVLKTNVFPWMHIVNIQVKNNGSTSHEACFVCFLSMITRPLITGDHTTLRQEGAQLNPLSASQSALAISVGIFKALVWWHLPGRIQVSPPTETHVVWRITTFNATFLCVSIFKTPLDSHVFILTKAVITFFIAFFTRDIGGGFWRFTWVSILVPLFFSSSDGPCHHCSMWCFQDQMSLL